MAKRMWHNMARSATVLGNIAVSQQTLYSMEYYGMDEQALKSYHYHCAPETRLAIAIYIAAEIGHLKLAILGPDEGGRMANGKRLVAQYERDFSSFGTVPMSQRTHPGTSS